MKKRSRPWKVGDVYSIALSNGLIAYCRFRERPTAEFFDQLSADVLPISEIKTDRRKFAISVDRTIQRHPSFSYLGNIACEAILEVPRYWNPGNKGKYFLYEPGYPAGRLEITEDQALQMEPLAVWSDVHILQRLEAELL
jgi:hypothetical protein